MRGLGSNRTFLGVGAVGLVCGSLLAVALGGGEAPRAEVTPARGDAPAELVAEPQTAAADQDAAALAAQRDALAVATLMPVIASAHQRLHAPGEAEALDAALRDALAARFAKDPERKRLVKTLYGTIGVGRFARGGRLTALGRAVVARVAEVGRHGVDPAPYDVSGLDAVVASLGGAVATAEEEAAERADERDADDTTRVLTELLDGSSFDAAHATERLTTLATVPTAADVDALATTLQRRGVRGVVRAADVAPDVRVADALVQLALDFRFVKKAGPFDLRRAETVIEKRKESAALLATLEGIATGDPATAMQRLDPPHPLYAGMLAVHDRYRGYVAAGGCKALPTSWKIRPGATGDEVKRLLTRLACEGYYDGPLDAVYEGAALAAGRAYQREHDLPAEGNIFEDTLKSMNVAMERRADQVALVLQRMRESEIGTMADFFIRVNIPAFELQVFEGGKVIRRQRIVVGTNRLDDDKQKLVQGHLNRTQLFTTRLYEIIVHPAWILPARVEHGELQGKMTDDPEYLAKHNIKQHTLDSGKKVYIQGFGDGNVLGDVKFLLEKSNAIYLHDTDKPALFRERRRDFSHGCMRVDEAVDFSKWLLARDGFSDDEVRRAYRMKEYQRGFDLKKPIDLLTEYMTVELTDDGRPIFLTDVYQYDKDYFAGELPPEVTARWGATELRPRWVPRVPRETVDAWRAAGKPAPRDYDPTKDAP